MPTDVEAILKPVLVALEASDRSENHEKEYEAALGNLLGARGVYASQARVALMDYYVGEWPGEVLACAVALDEEDIVPILDQYDKCDIKLSTSVGGRDRTLQLRAFARELRRSGKAKESCSFK
jgi:hypothetical protein